MVRQKGKTNKSQRIVAGLLTLIVILAAILVFLYRDELFGSGIKSEQNSTKDSEAYTYENGANQQFALMGDCLAVSSSTGLQVLDNDGSSVFRQVFSMKNPAVDSGDKHSVFYDIGGTALRLYSNGQVKTLDVQNGIISVSMNASGYFALAAEESGYKGSVVVYNRDGEAIYKWYSGTGYVLDAAISPDSKSLAVLTADSSGSQVHLFRLESEEETATVYIPNELVFKLSYTANNRFCVLSESSLRFFSGIGEDLSSMNFAGAYLIDYMLSDELCAVVLSKYVSGSDVSLTGFSDDGDVLGTTELDFAPLCLSSGKNKLLVLGSGAATVLSKEMKIISETEIPAGYGDAVYLPNGDALLLSSYHGERVDLK